MIATKVLAATAAVGLLGYGYNVLTSEDSSPPCSRNVPTLRAIVAESMGLDKIFDEDSFALGRKYFAVDEVVRTRPLKIGSMCSARFTVKRALLVDDIQKRGEQLDAEAKRVGDRMTEADRKKYALHIGYFRLVPLTAASTREVTRVSYKVQPTERRDREMTTLYTNVVDPEWANAIESVPAVMDMATMFDQIRKSEPNRGLGDLTAKPRDPNQDAVDCQVSHVNC